MSCAANRQTSCPENGDNKEHKSEGRDSVQERKLLWVIRLQTDTCRCHLILHSLTPPSSRRRAGRYEGIEPCSVNLTCAGDTVANEDTLQGQWILIVPPHFQRSVTLLPVYSASDWHILYKIHNSVKTTTRYSVCLFRCLCPSHVSYSVSQ